MPVVITTAGTRDEHIDAAVKDENTEKLLQDY
jgi:hypothetical protein